MFFSISLIPKCETPTHIFSIFKLAIIQNLEIFLNSIKIKKLNINKNLFEKIRHIYIDTSDGCVQTDSYLQWAQLEGLDVSMLACTS
jgi:hypothetical protein